MGESILLKGGGLGRAENAVLDISAEQFTESYKLIFMGKCACTGDMHQILFFFPNLRS